MVDEPQSELEALQAALGARARIRQWAEGAELLDLLHAAASEGWLETLTRPVTVEVFLAAGVVREAAGTPETLPAFTLTEDFAALQAGPSGIGTDIALDAVDAARARIRTALTASAPYDWQEDALVVAQDWGMLPSDASRALSSTWAAGSAEHCSAP